MGTTAELIQELLDERMRAVEEEKKLVEQVEARGGEWSAEDTAKKERLDDDIDGLKKRADALHSLSENTASLEDQRAKFERMIRPDGERHEEERSAEDRITAFFRGAPTAPKKIDVAITPAVKRMVTSAHRRGLTVDDLILSGELESRDLVKGTTTAGGYTVPTGFLARLWEHLVEMSGIRQTNAEVLTTASGEDIPVPKTTSHGTNAGIIAEGVTITEGDPAFGQVTLKAYGYKRLIQLSSELLQDTAIDILGYVGRAAGIQLALGTGGHFITGTGTSEPEGVMTNITAGKVMPTGNTAGFTTAGTAADCLFEVEHSIVSGYRRRAMWLMNDATLAKARMIRDTTNQYLWQPGLQAGVPDRLLGYPVVTDPFVAVFAASAKVAAFGDFSRYYVIRDVAGVRFERSDDYAFGNDLVSFRAILRTDGKVVDATAVKSLVASAT